jgi:hypothetical protein
MDGMAGKNESQGAKISFKDADVIIIIIDDISK